MKQAMSSRAWATVRHRLRVERERQRADTEIRTAKAIQREFPAMTWGTALAEACRILNRNA